MNRHVRNPCQCWHTCAMSLPTTCADDDLPDSSRLGTPGMLPDLNRHMAVAA